MSKSSLERAFLHYWTIAGRDLPQPKHNYRFAALTVGTGRGLRARLRQANLRDWKFDFAWPEVLLAVELEGGTYTRGRHVRPAGYEADCEKYNAGIALGWAILRYTNRMLNDHPLETFAQIQDLYDERQRTHG